MVMMGLNYVEYVSFTTIHSSFFRDGVLDLSMAFHPAFLEIMWFLSFSPFIRFIAYLLACTC